MSELLQALSTPRRRELLRLLWAGERTAGELRAELPDVTFGAVSQQLRVLADAGLVQVRRDGRFRRYRADKQALAPFRRWLEAQWSSALYRLKLAAELEAGRRGPQPRPAHRRRKP
ncbi:MAG TPA: metalloregulator ArsR/SmtB family transcription factor [Planctomycetota bacterium]|nr:metalloregulator ArsR/SmtB family transcription factor [Planctomycetota bacterium]